MKQALPDDETSEARCTATTRCERLRLTRKSFVTVEARDPTLATTVHDLHNYSAKEIRFGMRYSDAVTAGADGTPLLDLTRIGALEPDVGDRQEQGWTEREESSSRQRD